MANTEDVDFIVVGMFILLVEYGLVHRGDCINCETCYFCFDLAFVWPGLRACTRTGR